MKTGTFDTESDGLLQDATRLWCAVVRTHGTDEEAIFTPENINDLPSYLDTFDVLIGHNVIGHDFPLLRKLYGYEYKGQKIDTLLMSRTQRPDREFPPGFPDRSSGPHSVAAWGWRLGHHKLEHEDWSQYSDAMLARCRTDAAIQEQIYYTLLKEGEGEGWEDAHQLNSKLFHYLQMQEEYGWLVDREHIDRCLVRLDRWIDRIDRAVSPKLPLICEPEETKKAGEYGWVKKPFKKNGSYTEAVKKFIGDSDIRVVGPFSRVSFRPTNINSNAEVKEFLLQSGWEPTEWNTNNDGKRTSPKFSKDDQFEGIQGSLGRLIAKRIQCRQRKSVLNGWRDSIREDGRISPGVNGVATTGRIRHKGIVNVPNPDTHSFFAKEMRRVFICRPDWVLVGCDSDANQMRQLAGRMMAAFPPEGDKEFNYAIMHGDKSMGTDLHSLNQKRSGVDSRTKAKNFFYGCILFGAGDPKTAKVIGGTVPQARQLKQEFFQEMPMLRKLIDMEIVAWRKTARKVFNKRYNRVEYSDGFVRGLDGRPIKVEFEKDILVYLLQSDEAIQMAAAYCWVHKQLEKRGYKWKEDFGFVIWYHDEYICECRPEIAEEVKALMEEGIAWAGRFYGIPCPHVGDGKIGRNWKEVH